MTPKSRKGVKSVPSLQTQDVALYQRLAELARANVTGAMGRKLVIQAQHELVDKMLQKGLIDLDDANDLKM